MKNQLIKLFCLGLLSISALSCKKEYGEKDIAPLAPSYADVPVTVTNAAFTERFPVVTTSVAAGGRFTINFEIPADKGKIREITRVTTTSAGNANYTALNSSSPATAYNATGTGTTRVVTPIKGNGSNQISFSSDLATYLPYRIAVGTTAGPAGPQVGPPATPGGPATGPVTAPVPSTTSTPTDIQFYFLFTLEDSRTIISTPVKVRVTP